MYRYHVAVSVDVCVLMMHVRLDAQLIVRINCFETVICVLRELEICPKTRTSLFVFHPSLKITKISAVVGNESSPN